MEALGGSRGGDGWQPPPGIKLESLPLEDLARLVVTNIVPSSVYGREAFAIELGMALLEGGEAAMRKAEVVTERHAPRQQLQHTMLRALVATGLVAADDPRLHSLSAEQVCVCLFVGQPVLPHRSSARFAPIHKPFHARSHAQTPQKTTHTRARLYPLACGTRSTHKACARCELAAGRTANASNAFASRSQPL